MAKEKDKSGFIVEFKNFAISKEGIVAKWSIAIPIIAGFLLGNFALNRYVPTSADAQRAQIQNEVKQLTEKVEDQDRKIEDQTQKLETCAAIEQFLIDHPRVADQVQPIPKDSTRKLVPNRYDPR